MEQSRQHGQLRNYILLLPYTIWSILDVDIQIVRNKYELYIKTSAQHEEDSHHVHIFTAPFDVHDFARARYSEMTMTTTPKPAHRTAGNFVRLYHGIFLSTSLM